MSKIDIDKFVASVYKHEVQKLPSGGQWSTTLWTLDEALREQGLKYKAGEIIELSNVSENGKECKPANFAKSSKDLQEAPHGDDCKGCKGFEETGKCYCEGCEGMPQELTEFEENFLAILYSWCKGDDRVYNECKDGALKDAKKLLEIAYYEFEKVLLNSKLEYFENLFVRFNDAVDEEIKRKCEKIDVDEMFDKVPPRILKTYFDFYKKGVVDTINKLKGE